MRPDESLNGKKVRRFTTIAIRPVGWILRCVLAGLFIFSSIGVGSLHQQTLRLGCMEGSGHLQIPIIGENGHLQESQEEPFLLSKLRSLDREDGFEGGDDSEARRDWFISQRTYPFSTLPRNARRNAWVSRPRQAVKTLMEPNSIWKPVGPLPSSTRFRPYWSQISGRVNTIAICPTDAQLILIGASTGGIWRSTDGGDTFAPVSDSQVDLAVGSIAFAPSSPSIVYAGMGDSQAGYLGNGVLKSTDSGQSWARVSNNTLPSPGTTSKLLVDPSNPSRVYIAQLNEEDEKTGNRIASGFYFSTDGGVNWVRTLRGVARDAVIDSVNYHILYLAMRRVDQQNLPAGLYRSTNSGMTWTNIYASPAYDPNAAANIKVAVTPANPQAIYLFMGGSLPQDFDARVVVSTDGGATWANRGSSGIDTAQFSYNNYLYVSPDDANSVYIGTRDIFHSTDAGSSWINLTQNVAPDGTFQPKTSRTHEDQHAFAFSPTNTKVIFIGNDGGVWKSTNSGKSFKSLNATLSLTQFVSLVINPSDPQISYGGTQDNGTQKRTGSQSWEELRTGDGGDCVINPLDARIIFATYEYGIIYLLTDDGATPEQRVSTNETFGEPDVTSANPSAKPRIAFYAPLVGNEADSTLYFGTWRLFKSTDLGGSWSAPAGMLDLTKGGNDVLSTITIAPSNPRVIYTGSSQGRAMVSADGGHSWVDMSAGLPNRFITSITVDRSNAAVAFLTVSGFGSGHVFQTTSFGASWTDISGNLPNVPTQALLISPTSLNTLYVGTDVGVFRSTTGGLNWESFNAGLPPVIVMAFASRPAGVIQAATYGRGIYEFVEEPSSPIIDFANMPSKKTLIISGNGFGSTPQVVINNSDRTGFIISSSNTRIQLKGKARKMGLVEGENTIQVNSANGMHSNIYILRR